MAIKTFTAGSVLTAADTNTYLANSGLVYVTQQTFTSSTSFDIKQCFTSTYEYYRITIAFSSASGTLNFQLLNGSTPTIINAANYYGAGFRVAYNSGLTAAQDAASTQYAISDNQTVSPGANFILDFRYNPSAQSMWSSFGHAVSNGITVHKSGGYHTTVAHDGFRLSSSANMAGIVRVYGYRQI